MGCVGGNTCDFTDGDPVDFVVVEVLPLILVKFVGESYVWFLLLFFLFEVRENKSLLY